MKHSGLLFCILVLLSACRKDNPMEFTSDLTEFKTNIVITYYQNLNKTYVEAYFSYTPYQTKSLQMPSNSYLKINGTELTWYDYYYLCEFTGKGNCLIEFKNYDEIIYINNLIAPDTAYFVNLPDTLSHSEDFVLQVNAPDLDNNESTEIGVDSYSFDYGYSTYSTDSLITIHSHAFQTDSTQRLHMFRMKSVLNPNLPLGGGEILYKYYVTDTFYTK